LVFLPFKDGPSAPRQKNISGRALGVARKNYSDISPSRVIILQGRGQKVLNLVFISYSSGIRSALSGTEI